MIDRDSHQLSIRRQCELVDVNRNRLTPPPDHPGADELELCRLIDEIHTRAPAFGSRKIRDLLRVEYNKRTTRGRLRHQSPNPHPKPTNKRCGNPLLLT